MSKGVLINQNDVPVLRKMVQEHRRKRRGSPQTLRKRWPVGGGGGGGCDIVRYQMLVDATGGSIIFPFQINTEKATVTIDWNETPSALQAKFIAAFAALSTSSDLTITGFDFPYGSMDLQFDQAVFTDPTVGLIQDSSGTITDTLTSYVETRFRIIRVNNS